MFRPRQMAPPRPAAAHIYGKSSGLCLDHGGGEGASRAIKKMEDLKINVPFLLHPLPIYSRILKKNDESKIIYTWQGQERVLFRNAWFLSFLFFLFFLLRMSFFFFFWVRSSRAAPPPPPSFFGHLALGFSAEI